MAPFSKPETVLKQAEGLVSVGQTHAALQSLSEMFSSKRFRSTPLNSLEPIMLRFMELCVEMRKGRAAKEGLMQYKNIAQNSSVGSIEVVVSKFIEMAEAKVKEAQGRAEKAAGVGVDVDDLEAPSTPESILLSSVSFSSSSDPSKDRTDRALVTPSLKFLWESYRTSLETLKNNSRLEGIYTSVAHAAFKFCLAHVRKVEFRRLCDTLRLHLTNVGKYAHQPHSINLSDSDTLQRHLDTRFSQLHTSIELELWQEAFRSVEDIHNLLSMAPKKTVTMKQDIMAGYYEKLSKIFLMSGNALYHAAAWGRYYELAQGKTDAEKAALAAKVVVSALAVPVGSNANSGGSSRLTALLNLSKPPTRAGLLRDALARNVLRLSPPTVKELYHALEVDFDPLTLCETIAPLLAELAAESSPSSESDKENPYTPYLPLLHQALLSRLLAHLSEVYSSIKIDNFIQLIAPLKSSEGHQIFSAAQIESYIMGCARRGELNVRIDHAEGCIVFVDEPFAYGSSSAASGTGSEDDDEEVTNRIFDDGYKRIQPSATALVKTRLSTIAGTLHRSLQVLEAQGVVDKVAVPASSSDKESTPVQSQEERIKTLLANLPAYRKQLILHQSLTARRRQLQQELAARTAAQNQTMQAEALKKAKDAALAHSLAEAREREASRRKAEMERIRRDEAEKYAKGLVEGGVIGKDVVEISCGGFLTRAKIQSSSTPLDTTDLIKMQVIALEKDKSLRASRLKVIAKRIDHLERAYRVSEMPLIKNDYEGQQLRDKEAHIQAQNDLMVETRRQFEEDVETKKRLARMVAEYEKRKVVLVKRKGEEFALKRDKAQRRIESEKQKRREELSKKRADEIAAAKAQEEEEKREAEAEAQRQREEEEARQETEREAQAAKEEEEEEEKRKQEEAEKEEREREDRRKEREAERQKAFEQARLQREREEEAERRRAQRASERAAEKSKPAAPEAPSTGGGVWRRRTAADSPSATPASSVPATPTKGSGFGSRVERDVPARLGSPAPAAAAPAPGKYRPGQGLGGTGGAGWRAREEAKGKGDAPTPPSRTESPAPPASNRVSGIFGSGSAREDKSETKQEEDGFTVVGGGEKKNVWKPKRMAGR
ncbi:hypothetical protein D9757_010415 [Collybiopsis confluens]|uniref:Eukaryotic translation initiation factor 3 subunit A n=1 Tax=Collybiopsis confluens TaxID=2823264 RepID=A0A8H5LTB3_9AGAR|nr:hypothetical protein D9757_010415 [Collybiopsis confluens]